MSSNTEKANFYIGAGNTVDPRDFLTYEFEPLANEMYGPIDSFKLDPEYKVATKQRAIETGSLESANFHDCPIFDNKTMLSIRRDVKRAKEIADILFEGQVLTLEDRVALDYADRMVWQASLVEAARQVNLYGDSPKSALPATVLELGLEKLYPKPDPNVAAQCLGLFEPRIEVMEDSDDPKIKQLATTYRSKYTFIEAAKDMRPEALNPNKQADLQELLQEEYRTAFDAVKAKFGKPSNARLVDITDEFLVQCGLSERDKQGNVSGWKTVRTTDSQAGYKVIPEVKEISLGDRTKEITWDAFEKLMVHEVGVHAMRAENASKTGFKPLEIGLDGYEETEEGLGILFEQIWAGKTSGDVVDKDHYRYLIAAYACGSLDNQKHGIDETYKFATDIKIASLIGLRMTKGKEVILDDVIKEARTTIFEHVFRAFRGMPQGFVMTKDVTYYAGKAKLINYVNKSDIPTDKLLDFLTRGKFDPTNEQHVLLVEQVYGN